MTAPNHTGVAANQAPYLTMMQLIVAFQVSRAVHVMAELGLADLLHEGPKNSEQLAAATGTHAPSLHRVLRALASFDVLAADGAGCFSLTRTGETLRTDIPGSLRHWALLLLGNAFQHPWDELMHTVRTGETAFQRAHGTAPWDYLSKDPELRKTFDAAMAGYAMTYNAEVVASYPFSTLGTIVDVGGGDGSQLIGILRANPACRGIVFDLPQVAEKAAQHIAAAGLADRCQAVAGDAFVSVPEGADAYLLSRVVHDWDDDRACAMLAVCRRALTPSGRLLLIERDLAELAQVASTRSGALSDLNMLVLTGGRERTNADYRVLLRAAGLDLARTIRTDAGLNIMEAIPSSS